MEFIAAKINELKLEAHICRKKLRRYLFKGGKQSDGSFRIYSEKEIPPETENDGHLWRIKVGNKQLDNNRLVMVGGGEVVGVVPRGLPSLSVPKINLRILLNLFPFAAIISLLGFMEAISIAKAIVAKTGQKLDPNRELIGQGLSNILGAARKSHPVSGFFQGRQSISHLKPA